MKNNENFNRLLWEGQKWVVHTCLLHFVNKLKQKKNRKVMKRLGV